MEQAIQTILSLPLDILAILAAGYIGYCLACAGKDQLHKAHDALFISIVFGAIARLVMEITGHSGILSSLAGVAAAIGSAIFWRRYLDEWIFHILRKFDISHARPYETAFQAITDNPKMRLTQIEVALKNGNRYMCDWVGGYEDSTHGSSYFGSDGSVAMFVTSYKYKGDEEWEDYNPKDEAWGNVITCFAADEIAYTEIRSQ